MTRTLHIKKIGMKVDNILDTKHTDPEVDASDFEEEIDRLVYELYNLTKDEIAIVEGTDIGSDI